jgi:hypothetical protein
MFIGFHVKYPLYLSDYNETLNFLARFSIILKYQISWKSVQWQPSCSMRTDIQTNEQTDRSDESSSRFSQFCELTYKRLRTLLRVSPSNVHMNRKINLWHMMIYAVARGDYEPCIHLDWLRKPVIKLSQNSRLPAVTPTDDYCAKL